MVEVKPLEEIKENFKQAAPLVPDRYKRGVRRAKWQQAALDGQDLYEQQMTNPTVLSRRGKQIAKVSDEEWRRDAENKGGAIIGTRIAGAVDKQAAGFAPYRETLVNVSLPPRTTDVMTNVTNRVGAVAQAMANKKKELMG